MKQFWYSKIKKRINQLYYSCHTDNYQYEIIATEYPLVLKNFKKQKKIRANLTPRGIMLNAQSAPFPELHEKPESLLTINRVHLVNHSVFLYQIMQSTSIDLILKNLLNSTTQTFYKKWILKRFLFFKRKLKSSHLLFFLKISKLSSVDSSLFKINTQVLTNICMNSFIDFIQKKLIDEKYQNKWMVSSLSESNKFFFLLNNYWVNSYSYVSFLFNSDQIEQRGKGFEINQFMIQFTLFRRFLFEIFSLIFCSGHISQKETEKMLTRWELLLSFLNRKSFFQNFFFKCLYFLNDFEFQSKNQIFRLTDRIEKTWNICEIFNQKNYWMTIFFNRYSEYRSEYYLEIETEKKRKPQNLLLSNNSFFISSVLFKHLCSGIEQRYKMTNYAAKFDSAFSTILIDNLPFLVQFDTFTGIQILDKTFVKEISESLLRDQLNIQIQTYLVAKKELFLLFVNFYKSTNPYQILNIETFQWFFFRKEIFYFHPSFQLLNKYKNVFQLDCTLFSPKKWQSSWMYFLSNDLVIWQHRRFPNLFSCQIFNFRSLFFKQSIRLLSLKKNVNSWTHLFSGPSLWKVRIYLKKLKQILQQLRAATQFQLIRVLGPKIRLWSNYYKFTVPKSILDYCDSILFQFLWKWAIRRHSNKSKHWIKNKYFSQKKHKKWIFATALPQPTAQFLKENPLFNLNDCLFEKNSTSLIQLPFHNKKERIVDISKFKDL